MRPPFFIWQDRVLKKIQPEDVIAISSEKNYIKIFVTGNGYYLVRSTLTAALKKLPSDLIKRVHNRLAVSVNYADYIAKDHLQIEGGENPLPISRLHYRAFINSLNIIGGDDSGKKRNSRK
ncbi:LytTR family DNA-binding domain-containing protein [Sediminibacterium sp.]|uniref:LytTR family DNA-binding domain-containing protein n=1 Tax=Sediminibacterium sp. TaxID=1917865 RepID=UPI0025F6D087|nr:LytTR family DNA-binding domain-containing protein [Sediminibacterium sp.]MBW0177570.1 LytTR family transcriptional regulator [Sediminibacterium sp.]